MNRTLPSGVMLVLLLSATIGHAGGSAEESCTACLHVSTTGSDSNPGSYASPYLTIQKAASVAAPGQTIFIRGGTYRESVTPAQSGTSGQPITYTAYSGEAVTISGTEPVTGWSPDSGEIYKATMNWSLRPPSIPPASSNNNPVLNNQVFFDGKMMVEARFPNVDTVNISLYPRAVLTSVSGNLASMIVTASGLDSSTDFYKGASLSVLPNGMWLAIPATVTASSGDQLSLSFLQTQDSSLYFPQAGNLFYLEGTRNLLDAPGEWFLDPNTATLYLKTPNLDSPSMPHVVEAKKRDIAFDLSGKSHIVIKNLKLFAARVVTDDTSSYNTLDGLDIEYVAHNVLRRSSAESRSGIYLAGSHNSLINSQIQHCSHTCVSLSGDSHLVKNNVITDADYVATYDAAIGVRQGAADILIEANTLSDTGRSAIDMSSGCDTSRIRILNNTIFNTMLQTTDGGAIYTFDNDGGGAEIAYNLIYNTREKMLGAPNGGIYLDNNSTHFKVHHNVVAHTEYGINLGLPITTDPPNNNSCRTPRADTETMVHKVHHNTLSNSYLAFVASAPAGQKPGRTAEGTTVLNNIGYVTEISVALKNPKDDRGGVVSNNSNPSQDPRFIDPDTLNFGLQASSTAVINKGVQIADESYPVVDSVPDEGAFEYPLPPWTSGATRSPPSVPTNVTVSGIGNATATLTWSSVAGISHYTVERATRFKTNPYRQLVRVPSATTSIAFNDLVANTPYFYRVRAVDYAGNYSPLTAPVALRTSGSTSALSVFQGESHDAMVDGVIVNNNSAIGYLRTSSSLIYRNVDFSLHPDTLESRIESYDPSAGNPIDPLPPNTIEFRAGSPTGALIASIDIPISGGIAARNSPANTSALAITDVYVLFKGATPNWNFGAFDRFRFSFGQVITFTSTPPPDATVGGASYTVTATGGGSGSAIVFSIDAGSTGVCSISGATVTFIGAGVCLINANQAGNASYSAASQVQQSIAVATAPAPAVLLNPTALAFSNQTVGTTSPAQTVTLTNTGNAMLHVSSIVSSNSAFGVIHDCGNSVIAGAHCALMVTFKPTTAASTPGSLTITTTAAGSPHVVTLNGVGTAVGAPVCTLTANPPRVRPSGTATLIANCTNAPTSYTWTGGSCTGTGARTCSVAPATTTEYSVTGINGAGSGSASTRVMVISRTGNLIPPMQLLLLD